MLNQFFSLLRAGLWQTEPEASLFDEATDWKAIYEMARRQALLAVMLDGVDRLPDSLKPPRPIYLKWCANVLKTEDANRKLNKEVANLFSFLQANGVEPVLVKGQSLSRLYPEPTHRTCGDIDIYIGKKNYDKVSGLLSQEGSTIEKWSPKHIMFSWHGVTVENHRMLIRMFEPRADCNLQKRIEQIAAERDFEIIDVGGCPVATVPPDFNAPYILMHAVNHVLGVGVGLRQVCDWTLFLHRRHAELHWDSIRKMLEDTGIFGAWRIFGALAVKYLGLPEEDLFIKLTDEDYKEGDLLLQDLLYNGNFGFHGDMVVERPKGFWRQRLFNYRNYSRRRHRLRKLAPGEVTWGPLMSFVHFLQARYYMLRH